MKLKIYFADISVLSAEREPVMPALQRLLAVGRCTYIDEALPVLLCQQFGVQMQADWPIAALSWLGAGADPAADYWLQADFVHLVLQRDSFSLGEPVPLALNRQHAETLIADLNRHFSADGLQFHIGPAQSPHAGRCYLRLEVAPQLITSLPETAMGRDIRSYLPQGEDAAQWQRLGNEVQMLLHDHPVNRAREANGELPVNSLWFSGGGVLPARLVVGHGCVYSDMPLFAGFARAAGLPVHAVPDTLQPLLDRAGDSILGVHGLEQAEQRWFSPSLSALRSRESSQINLYFPLRERVLSVEVHWYDLFKFWRQPKPLRTYFLA